MMIAKKRSDIIPDIGCTIREVRTEQEPREPGKAMFDVQPNDPDAYARLIREVEADVAD